MRTYAYFDTDGALRRFEHLEGDAEPAPSAVLLTEEQFQDLAANQGLRRLRDGEIVEIEPPPQMVATVSAAQAKIWLARQKTPDGSNLLRKTREMIEASDDDELQIWFADARTWEITNPRVLAIGALFNLEADAIQAAFNEASTIAA